MLSQLQLQSPSFKDTLYAVPYLVVQRLLLRMLTDNRAINEQRCRLLVAPLVRCYTRTYHTYIYHVESYNIITELFLFLQYWEQTSKMVKTYCLYLVVKRPLNALNDQCLQTVHILYSGLHTPTHRPTLITCLLLPTIWVQCHAAGQTANIRWP